MPNVDGDDLGHDQRIDRHVLVVGQDRLKRVRTRLEIRGHLGLAVAEVDGLEEERERLAEVDLLEREVDQQVKATRGG